VGIHTHRPKKAHIEEDTMRVSRMRKEGEAQVGVCVCIYICVCVCIEKWMDDAPHPTVDKNTYTHTHTHTQATQPRASKGG
jgi:hypothetical protein